MTAAKPAAVSTESFDGFWAEVTGADRTETIRGVTVRVPTDMPLEVEKRADELAESDRIEDVGELLSMLFGQSVLEQWTAAGMGLLEFQTVLTWAMGNAMGKATSFREAYDLVQAGDMGKAFQPKPQNRAARRAQSKTTGGRSKRTSSANTGSARKTSGG